MCKAGWKAVLTELVSLILHCSASVCPCYGLFSICLNNSNDEIGFLSTQPTPSQPGLQTESGSETKARKQTVQVVWEKWDSVWKMQDLIFVKNNQITQIRGLEYLTSDTNYTENDGITIMGSGHQIATLWCRKICIYKQKNSLWDTNCL